ncbi:Metallo-dependent phosphatase [Neolentinus lepideus HHB14362 ss-1]|uniref:Metallo-dependent phosphatase n=1 Tax=Neolentinus lepideus HHB14362 ss-1 TaxID=1314782 RepID=A0A165T9F5_9AGAM|nr:Metallo-dependent phosphatase [Neolentinus lepideus HHB14362 ss-1]
MTDSEPTVLNESLRFYANYTECPGHPGPEWTRFVCISDTHSRKYPVPPGDVLLHSGDLSRYGSLSALNATIIWLQALPHTLKLIIAGNHDLCLDANWAHDAVLGSKRLQVTSAQALLRSPAVLEAGIRYLEHEPYEFTSVSGKQWKVYGSPAAPHYSDGAFQYETEQEADAIYNCIPLDTEILLTHTPPYRILDKTRQGKHAGCPRLAARMSRLNACRLHVFGHIHEAHGTLLVTGDPGRLFVTPHLPWEGNLL